MARIWRDKQKKPCVMYRLLTTGTVEEKIYQRQRAKGEIADVTIGSGGGVAGGGAGSNKAEGSRSVKGQFSKEELKQLFTLRTDTKCDTADVLKGGGSAFRDVLVECEDGPLGEAVAGGSVTFVHLERKEGGATTAATAIAVLVGDQQDGAIGALGLSSGNEQVDVGNGNGDGELEVGGGMDVSQVEQDVEMDSDSVSQLQVENDDD